MSHSKTSRRGSGAAAPAAEASPPAGRAAASPADLITPIPPAAESEAPGCSPGLRRILEGIPREDVSPDELNLLAQAAIKFGIEPGAWVARVLERSTSQQTSVERFLAWGARGIPEIARAILGEIVAWDADSESGSARPRIRALLRDLEQLYGGDPATLAETLDQFAAENAGDASFGIVVDAILGRRGPEATSLRRRWLGFDDDEAGRRAQQDESLTNDYDAIIDQITQNIPFVQRTWDGPDGPCGRGVDEEQADGIVSEGLPVDESTGAAAGRMMPSDALRGLAAGWPEDIGPRAAMLEQAHRDYREEYARQLGRVVNHRLAEAIRGGTSYEEKKGLIKSINETLRLGGLAIGCEERDEAGNLRAVHPGLLVIGTTRREGGRFRVEYRDASGAVKRPGLPDDSPAVELMPDPPRHGVGRDSTKADGHAERLAAEREMHAGHQR